MVHNSRIFSSFADVTEQRGFPTMTSHVKVEKVYGDKENCANNIDLYNWNVDVCANKQTTSDGEIIDVLGDSVTPRVHSSLIKGKKIMFVGMYLLIYATKCICCQKKIVHDMI